MAKSAWVLLIQLFYEPSILWSVQELQQVWPRLKAVQVAEAYLTSARTREDTQEDNTRAVANRLALSL